MTALTVRGSSTASTTLAIAGQMYTTTTATPGSVTTKVGTSTGRKPVYAKGFSGTSLTGVGAIPAPTDSNFVGWIFDGTTLEGQEIAAGTWTPTFNMLASTGTTITPTVEWFKRSSTGIYTSIGSVTGSSIALTTSSQALTFIPPSLSLMDFATGDKLCMWLWINQTAGGAANSTVTVVESTTTAGSSTAAAQTATPGYGPTPVALSCTCAGISTLSLPSYLYSKSITIPHANVSGVVDLTNYPLLISLTDANLATAANGGFLQNSNGYDIIFVDASGVKLDHELEKYVATTGELVAWVRIPTLSHTVDTTITCLFGNSNIVTSQENKAGVWDSNFSGVWHLKETSGNQKDSTANALDLTSLSHLTAQGSATGKIDGADQFTASGTNAGAAFAADSVALRPTGDMTVEAWVNIATLFTSGTGQFVYKDATASSYTLFQDTGPAKFAFQWLNTAGTTYILDGLTTPVINTWYHVVGIHDATNNVLHIYVNGVLDDSGTIATTGTMYITGPLSFYVGAVTAVHTLSATIDEVRLSKSVRPAGWITTSYTNQNSPGSFYSVGAFTEAFSLATSLSVTCTGAGTLTPTLSTASSGVSLSVTMTGVGTLAETFSLATNLTDTLSGVGTLTGTLTANLTLASLTMTGVGTLTASAQLSTVLTTTIAGVGILSGVLGTTAPVALSGTIAGAGTLTGTLSATTALIVTLAGSGTLTGMLTEKTSCTSTIAGVGTLAPTLVANLALSSVTVASAGTLTGTFTEATVLATTLVSSSIETATLSVTTSLMGILSGVGTLTCVVGTGGAFSTTLSGVGTLSATLSANFALSSVTLSSSGTFTPAPPTFKTAFSLTVPSVGTFTPTLSANLALSAVTLSATSTVTTTTQLATALSATVSGTGTLTGTTQCATSISGTVSSTATLTAVTTKGTALSASLDETSTLSGAYTVSTALFLTCAGAGILSSTLILATPITRSAKGRVVLILLGQVTHRSAGRVKMSAKATGRVQGRVIVLAGHVDVVFALAGNSADFSIADNEADFQVAYNTCEYTL